MTYMHDFNTRIFLDQDFTMYDKMLKWAQQISKLQLSGGGIKVIPSIKMRVKLLDSEHQYFTTSFVMEGVWLSTINQVQLSYQQGSQALMVDCRFKCQYYYRDDDCDLTMDPLTQSNILKAYAALQ